MKILFWFNWNSTYLCHAIAKYLKEKYNINDFSGLVAGRKQYEFLKKQKDIKYRYLSLVQDIYLGYKNEEIDLDYLSDLEKRYGVPNLWPFVYADRDLILYNQFKFTQEDYLKLLQRYFRSIIELIKNSNPDYVIFDCVISMPSYILYQVAQKEGIPTLMFTHTRIKNRITISRDTYEGFNKIFEIYDNSLTKNHESIYEKDAINFIKEFRTHRLAPDYMEKAEKMNRIKSSAMGTIKRATRLWYYFYHRNFGYFKDDYSFANRSTIEAAIYEVKCKLRKILLKRVNIFEKPDFREKYVFYPLHYEPELALMVMAPFYINQVSLIENISKSLPVTFKLYVKEHPQQFVDGSRPISYYKKLKEIPNVKLIDPNVSSYELIKNSQLVITITGTAGWEALLLKKPVISFGRVFYNKLNMVKKCENINALPHIIKNMVDNYEHNEEELIKFVTSIFEGSKEAEFSEIMFTDKTPIEIMSHPDIKTLAEMLINEMNIKSS